MNSDELGVQQRIWLQPMRITIVVCCTISVVSYLFYALGPLRWIWQLPSAYEDGLAGQPRTVLPAMVAMMGAVIGGPLLLINAAFVWLTWRRVERVWVRGTMALGVLVAITAMGLLALRDDSDRRYGDGLRDRVANMHIDFESIRAWAATEIPPADFQTRAAWPAAVQKLEPVVVSRMPDHRPDSVLIGGWGDQWGRWAIMVSPVDTQVFERSDVMEVRRVEPGVFVLFKY